MCRRCFHCHLKLTETLEHWHDVVPDQQRSSSFVVSYRFRASVARNHPKPGAFYSFFSSSGKEIRKRAPVKTVGAAGGMVGERFLRLSPPPKEARGRRRRSLRRPAFAHLVQKFSRLCGTAAVTAGSNEVTYTRILDLAVFDVNTANNGSACCRPTDRPPDCSVPVRPRIRPRFRLPGELPRLLSAAQTPADISFVSFPVVFCRLPNVARMRVRAHRHQGHVVRTPE